MKKQPTLNEREALMIDAALHAATVASMAAVKAGQLTKCAAGSVAFKPDATVLTSWDKLSENGGKAVLKELLADLIRRNVVSLHAEESDKEGDGRYAIYLDGLDGSRPFAAGAATSTVIAACYDRFCSTVLQCFVGEPATGRIWSIGASGRAAVRKQDGTTAELKVSALPPSGKSVVFIDSSANFTRGGRTILSDTQLCALHAMLFAEWNLLMLGSNGLHHALVAGGAELAAGAITTAIGGPWDVCPALLVLKAGGAAQGFRALPKGLEPSDPLAVPAYDILISGSSQDVVHRLTRSVVRAHSVRD